MTDKKQALWTKRDGGEYDRLGKLAYLRWNQEGEWGSYWEALMPEPMADELHSLTATVERYREAANTALFYLDHGKPVPYENHSCGPESACDMNCMEVAQYSEWRRNVALLTEKGD